MTLNTGKNLFFIALLPPKEVQETANEIKQYFADTYNSCAAKKSPPHVTLQAPFFGDLKDLPTLTLHLQQFAQSQAPIPLILEGFAAFKPRVIYINVVKTPELLTLEQNLRTYLESSLGIVDDKAKNRAFSPHLTVAYKDLTKANFQKAWPEFAERPLYYEFIVPKLTLLIHRDKKWHIEAEFFFSAKDNTIESA